MRSPLQNNNILSEHSGFRIKFKGKYSQIVTPQEKYLGALATVYISFSEINAYNSHFNYCQ